MKNKDLRHLRVERVPNERKAMKHAPILRHLTIPYRKTGRSVPGKNPCESILIGDAGSSHPGRPWAKTPRSSPLAPITNPLTIDHTEPLPSLPLTTSADHRGVDHRLPPPPLCSRSHPFARTRVFRPKDRYPVFPFRELVKQLIPFRTNRYSMSILPFTSPRSTFSKRSWKVTSKFRLTNFLDRNIFICYKFVAQEDHKRLTSTNEWNLRHVLSLCAMRETKLLARDEERMSGQSIWRNLWRIPGERSLRAKTRFKNIHDFD